MKAEADALKRKQLEEQRILDQREKDKNRMITIIVVCNVVILLLAFGVLFVLRRMKMKKQVQPTMTMKLEIPSNKID